MLKVFVLISTLGRMTDTEKQLQALLSDMDIIAKTMEDKDLKELTVVHVIVSESVHKPDKYIHATWKLTVSNIDGEGIRLFTWSALDHDELLDAINKGYIKETDFIGKFEGRAYITLDPITWTGVDISSIFNKRNEKDNSNL